MKCRKNVRCWHFWEKSGCRITVTRLITCIFHNMMEIGVCYYGEGTIVLEDKEIPYDGGGIYGSTKELSTYDKLKGKQSVLLGMAVY